MITTNSSGMRISLLLTRRISDGRQRGHSIGHEFSCLNLTKTSDTRLSWLITGAMPCCNDQIDDGMPMIWLTLIVGQPIERKSSSQYYVPYEVCTYRTADGDTARLLTRRGCFPVNVQCPRTSESGNLTSGSCR